MKSSPWFRWLGAGFRYRRQVSMKSSPYLPILFGTFLTIFVAVPKAGDDNGEQIKKKPSLYLNVSNINDRSCQMVGTACADCII